MARKIPFPGGITAVVSVPATGGGLACEPTRATPGAAEPVEKVSLEEKRVIARSPARAGRRGDLIVWQHYNTAHDSIEIAALATLARNDVAF